MDAGDIGDSGGALVTSGWSLDLEAALQDVRKSRKNRKNHHSAIFFAFAADDFFHFALQEAQADLPGPGSQEEAVHTTLHTTG